jgi:hypothetical protein
MHPYLQNIQKVLCIYHFMTSSDQSKGYQEWSFSVLEIEDQANKADV